MDVKKEKKSGIWRDSEGFLSFYFAKLRLEKEKKIYIYISL